VDPDGNSHEHVLRSLGDGSVDSEEIRSLEGLEAEAEWRDQNKREVSKQIPRGERW
jgi:hypothetical protein